MKREVRRRESVPRVGKRRRGVRRRWCDVFIWMLKCWRQEPGTGSLEIGGLEERVRFITRWNGSNDAAEADCVSDWQQ